MNRRLTVLLLFLLSTSGGMVLHAQEGMNPEGAGQAVDERLAAREAEFERLLDESLNEAQAGNWDRAMELLEEAAAYYPDDPRIEDYRKSFMELAALDNAQASWNEGTPAEVAVGENEEPAGEEGTEEEPRFVIDRGDMDPRESPALTRDDFRSELSLKAFAVDPVDSYARNGWTHVEEFFCGSLGADVAWWMPFMRKSLGLNFRTTGYAYRPGSPSLILNTLDLGLNLRGFLAETKTARLEIGLDFGGSFQTTMDVEENGDISDTEYNGALFLGLWVRDPLFYHLFRADKLQNLVFSGGIRIYSSFSEDIFEMVNYRIDGGWQFKGPYLGLRVEWWDFVVSDTRTAMMSFSILGGYRF